MRLFQCGTVSTDKTENASRTTLIEYKKII